MSLKFKKIQICNRTFDVTYVDTMSKVDSAQIEDLYGTFDTIMKEIRVFDGCDEEDQLDTLLHEIIHGVCLATKINLEEDQVILLTSVLADTLTRNGIIDTKALLKKNKRS